MRKKGRPPIEDKRDNMCCLRMNDEELMQLNFIAKETGLSKSEIIRELIYKESHLLYYGYPSQKMQPL